MESCAVDLRDDGIDLEAFDTKENAADVNSLRVALGYDQVDLLGVSYGSKLALTVMRDFPDTVRSAILASPLPLQANVLAGQIIGFDKALQRLFAACKSDPACAEDHPDLDLAFAAAVARLDEEPAELSGKNPFTGADLEMTIDGDAFIRTVYVATFAGVLLPFTPALIHAAAEGDYGPLEFVAPFGVTFGAGVSYGANFVYNCNDELAFTDPEEVTKLIDEAGVMPELADGDFAGTYSAFEVCDTFDLAAPARRENRPVDSEVPALIMAGEFDPITPPEYGFLAAETLPNSHVVVLRGLGHDPITSGGECAMAIATGFLADPNSEPDTACTEGLGLVFLG
jgi:pimeloyl-ACP methyl ester carboxylesterase